MFDFEDEDEVEVEDADVITTNELLVEGNQLIVTVDSDIAFVDSAGRSNMCDFTVKRINVYDKDSTYVACDFRKFDPSGSYFGYSISGKNVTDFALPGCDLTQYMGKSVKIEFTMTGSPRLYIVGFRNTTITNENDEAHDAEYVMYA